MMKKSQQRKILGQYKLTLAFSLAAATTSLLVPAVQAEVATGSDKNQSTAHVADLRSVPVSGVDRLMGASQTSPTQTADLPQSAASSSAEEFPDGEVLEEVNVTATRRPVRRGETSATVYTVRKEDFSALGASTVSDALSIVPGFQAPLSLGGINNFGAVYLRGFGQFDLLRDGLSLRRGQDNFFNISAIPLDDIERIEIVPSGATLRYGAGAVGGVINLITETPIGPPRLTLRYEAGTYGFSRYVGKYSGGDETFSYNLLFSSLVAFNDYPYSFTLARTPLFYGPTDLTPGGVPLFGLLRPESGPPASVTGRADAASNANDTYSAKFVLRPDPINKITLHLDQQNSKAGTFGPGNYAFGVCRGGQNTAPNGTLAGTRFLPVDATGNEVPCDQQRYLARTATTLFAPRFAYNASFDGSVLFPTGQAFRGTEPVTGSFDFFAQSLRTRTEASVQWDYQITPTTSLNSYIYYNRYSQANEIPPNYRYNTNLLGFGPAGSTGSVPIPNAQPFNFGERYEAQTLLSTSLSPGQILSAGFNFLSERFFQSLSSASSFTDNAISRVSVFFVDDISFSDQLKANVGVRYTSSSQFGEVVTPAAGLRFTPLSWLSLRGNYSQVYSPPALGALYLSGLPFIPNSNLRPESGVTYDIGFDIEPAPGLSLRATHFNTYLDGIVGAVQFANTDPFTQPIFPLLSQLQNLGSRQASGVELEARWQATPQFRMRAAWTYTDARNYGSVDSVDQPTFPFFFGYQDPYIPFNKVAASVTYANAGLIVSLVGQYNSGFRRGGTNAPTTQGGLDFTPDFATLDLNVEIPLTSFFILTGNVFNLTDTQYEYLPGVPAPGATFRVGGRINF